jgi:hypothetical protein
VLISGKRRRMCCAEEDCSVSVTVAVVDIVNDSGCARERCRLRDLVAEREGGIKKWFDPLNFQKFWNAADARANYIVEGFEITVSRIRENTVSDSSRSVVHVWYRSSTDGRG